MRIELLAVGQASEPLLPPLQQRLGRRLGAQCRIGPSLPDPEFAFHPERQQYHATEVLASLKSHRSRWADHLLGITAADLYIPVLTFVFGEAELGAGYGVVSAFRLRQQFYGLPADPGLLATRLMKEALHELGHASGLRHCDDYQCAMAASHAVEWIDVKSDGLCRGCRMQMNRLMEKKRAVLR